MRYPTVTLVLAAFLLVKPVSSHAGDYAAQKGGAHQKGCHDCCKHERGAPRGLVGGNARSAPVGPIVESMPLMPAVPSMVSMPMMLGTRAAATARDACDYERVDELDARVEALNLRMKTIQRAVELQTQILEELRASGSIGGRRLPGSTAAPTGS